VGAHSRHSQAEVSCANGHENPAGQYFCGQCGDPARASAVVCAVGHPNPDDQRSVVSAALRSCPTRSQPNSSAARWSVDPTARHQYPLLGRCMWTKHVAMAASWDPPVYQGLRAGLPESWIGIAAGLRHPAAARRSRHDIWNQMPVIPQEVRNCPELEYVLSDGMASSPGAYHRASARTAGRTAPRGHRKPCQPKQQQRPTRMVRVYCEPSRAPIRTCVAEPRRDYRPLVQAVGSGNRGLRVADGQIESGLCRVPKRPVIRAMAECHRITSNRR